MHGISLSSEHLINAITLVHPHKEPPPSEQLVTQLFIEDFWTNKRNEEKIFHARISES